MRLLWVENHAVFVRVAGRQFLGAHELTVAPSLAEARRSLASGTFDVVLLDYDLDDGKGTSLLALIQEQYPRPYVVAVSAHDAGNDALLAAGADAACPKGHFQEIGGVLARAREARDKADTADRPTRIILVPLAGGEAFTVTSPLTLVGRSEECEVQLEGAGVAEMHCVLALTDGMLLVRDLGTGSVRVNGERVRRGVLLRDDRLGIAAHEFWVRYEKDA